MSIEWFMILPLSPLLLSNGNDKKCPPADPLTLFRGTKTILEKR